LPSSNCPNITTANEVEVIVDVGVAISTYKIDKPGKRGVVDV